MSSLDAGLSWTSAWSRKTWPEEAFAALFQQQYPRIVSVVARMLGDQAQAEEIADDSFWKLYQRPHLSADGENPAGWLFRTASRMALDALRSRKRRRDHAAAFEADASLRSSAIPTPLTQLEQAERAFRVRTALAALKPLHAQALMLRHSGLSYAELALALDRKPSSIGTTLCRAERAFEQAFEKGNL
ncbi:MAG TPA: sigma-70 family RNA polymerase sigma factor [Terriglobales bacterium]|nr:sigma-70 family RNA polymerase sigma factor [Terriglobales bacterium]